MSEIIKFPYDVSRQVHSRKPRRSKNNTPEQRRGKTRRGSAMGGAVIPLRQAEVTEPTAIKQARAVRAVMETLDERELDAVRRVMDALRVGEAQA